MGRHQYKEHTELSAVVRARNIHVQHDKFLYILKGPDGSMIFYHRLRVAKEHLDEMTEAHQNKSCKCFELMYCLRPNTIPSWIAVLNEVADPIFMLEN